MVITVTQDTWKVDAIDVRHIEPSILEGEHLITSIFGPDSSKQIERWAPIFLQQPTISGNFLIPNRLTCNPGVISASPSPNVFYQWRADGVDIPGATNQWIDTVVEYDQVELTCYVDVVNQLGTANAETNGITAERLEPLRMEEHFPMAIQGLGQDKNINNMRSDILIASGLAQETRIDFMSAPMYFMTGMWVDLRDDTMSHTVASIQGLGAGVRTTKKHEVYAIENPDYLGEMRVPIEMANWTVLAGILQNYLNVSSTYPLSNTEFVARLQDDNVGTHYQELVVQQDQLIDAGLLTDIDLGIVWADFNNIATNRYGNDEFQYTVQILDGSDVELSNHTTGIITPDNDRSWTNFDISDTPIPALARKFRHTVTLSKNNTSNGNIDSFYENTIINFWKPDEHT